MGIVEYVFSQMSLGGIILSLIVAAVVIQRMLEPTLFTLLRKLQSFRSSTRATSHPSPSLAMLPRQQAHTPTTSRSDWKKAPPHAGLAAYKQKKQSSSATLH